MFRHGVEEASSIMDLEAKAHRAVKKKEVKMDTMKTRRAWQRDRRANVSDKTANTRRRLEAMWPLRYTYTGERVTSPGMRTSCIQCGAKFPTALQNTHHSKRACKDNLLQAAAVGTDSTPVIQHDDGVEAVSAEALAQGFLLAYETLRDKHEELLLLVREMDGKLQRDTGAPEQKGLAGWVMSRWPKGGRNGR